MKPSAMKVLLVHNHYRSGAPGGEDVAFRQERELLEHAGVRVIAYTRSNDEVDEHDFLAAAGTAISLRWSGRTFRGLSAILRAERPHVAHFHNTFPLISVSGYAACRSFGLADLDRASLSRYFPELAAHAESCRFRDCTHAHEPACAVRASVERGRLPRARYETYLRILASLE